jgi:hypothetical protein
MGTLIGLILLPLALMFQSAVLANVTLLHGAVDLILLIVVSWLSRDEVENPWAWIIIAGTGMGLISQIPVWLTLPAYALIGLIGVSLRRRIWQVPLFSLFLLTFTGTLLLHLITIILLFVEGVSLNLGEAFNQVTLPTLVLNMLVVVPVYSVVSEISALLYPDALDE